VKYLCNAFSLQMIDLTSPCLVRVSPLTEDEARRILGVGEVINAVGHPDTDRLIREKLGLSLPAGERKSIQLKIGDILVVAQYLGPRLPEGTTQLPPGARIEFVRVEVIGGEVR